MVVMLMLLLLVVVMVLMLMQHGAGRQGRADHHGQAGRRDEGVGQHRALVDPGQGGPHSDVVVNCTFTDGLHGYCRVARAV